MKYFILLCLFVVLYPVYAADDAECNFRGLQAEMIMEARQEGKNMSEVIKAWPSAKNLVIEAYEQPRLSTEDNKKIAVQDFTNKTILNCHKE